MGVSVTLTGLAEMFRDIFISEETGWLESHAGGATYTILFDRGLVARCFAGSEDQGSSDGGGATAETIKLAFGSVPDRLEFHPSSASAEEPVADILQTVEMFLLGVRHMAKFEEIREALGSIQSALVLRPNPSVPLERLALKPIHGFVLSRLGGGLGYSDIVATVGPEDESEAARFIYGLMLLGSVALDPPIGPGPLRTDSLLADRKRDLSREESETAFIRETCEGILGQNPLQILGVHETSTSEEIRHAYDERRRALASERFLTRVRENMHSELEIIESRLTEVYLMLEARAAWRSAPAEEGAPDLDAATLRRELTKTEAAANADEQMQLADSYYLKAKKFFSQGDYHNCIQFCTQAIRQNDHVARYFSLLGEAQSRNPDRRWQKMSEQSFLQAIKLDPWNADYLVILGQLYKKQGLASRARRQLERALELQPNHEKAREELNSLH